MNKYIGLPYKHKGRDFKGVDCYGLFRLIFQEEKGITLPDYTELKIDYDKNWYKNKDNNHFLNCQGTVDGTFWDTISTKPYKKFDLLLFYLKSPLIANHCGLYLQDSKFIHIYEDTTSTINSLDDLFWSSNLYGVIRYKR